MPDTSGYADFRSDTVTRPTPAMRKAMAEAEVGDDVFGEDPTVKELEAEAARITGMERALFVPSGTMGNQIAIHVHCRAGDEVLSEERSHCFMYEAAGAARFTGAQIRTYPARGGIPDVATVRAFTRSGADIHEPRTSLLVVENTHNLAGGRVVPLDVLRDLRSFCLENGLRLHVDGARIFNASAASGVPVGTYAACADTIMVSLSKALGAPVGSILCGSEEFHRRALVARKAFGGGMRQVGILAAAGLIALREGPELLKEDHKRARRLAAALEPLPGLFIDPSRVQTNIVMVKTPGFAAHRLEEALRTRRILVLAIGPKRLRMVLHRDVNDRDVFRLIGAMSHFTSMRPDELPAPREREAGEPDAVGPGTVVPEAVVPGTVVPGTVERAVEEQAAPARRAARARTRSAGTRSAGAGGGGRGAGKARSR